MPELGEKQHTHRRLAYLLALVNLCVPVFVAIERYGNNLSDSANIGVGWISAFALTALLLVGIYRRPSALPPQKSKSIILTSLALVVLSGLITTILIEATPSDNYLAVALSNTPLEKIKPERKRLVVDLIRQNKAASDENSRAAHSIKPISPALYSVQSFASEAAMKSTSSQLMQAYQVDRAYQAALHRARQDFQQKMQRVDPEFARGFETHMQKEDSLEASIAIKEESWVANVLSLYEYAAAHAGEITIGPEGHLIFANDEVKQSLRQQINTSETLQEAMSDEREKAVNNQHTLQDALGVKHSD